MWADIREGFDGVFEASDQSWMFLVWLAIGLVMGFVSHFSIIISIIVRGGINREVLQVLMCIH
jgi:uncharacterized membrane protein YedE/YeeE